jgi:choline dehydrogenase-like flavoprotein
MAAPASGVGSTTTPSDQQIQAKCYAFGKNTHEYFVNDARDAYCTPWDRPFSWIRVRAAGGKSLLWAGHCYRMTDLEFKAANTGGDGEAWPITYQEISPYYDKAEHILQVRNARPGLADVHDGYAGDFSKTQARLAAALATKGGTLLPARVSHSSFEQATERPCIRCGQMAEDCLRPVTSLDSTLALARKTGLLTLWTDSSVRSVITGSDGKAAGVAGVHGSTGEYFEVTGRLIFLCASALESTRILLNSASPMFPDGPGNSSGVLGHYLMDHVSGIVLTAICDDDGVGLKENGRAGMFYVPRGHNLDLQNLNQPSGGPFLRGYGFQGFVMRADHELLPCGRTQRTLGRSQGAPLNPGDGVLVRLVGFGEMLPQYDNYVEIDKEGGKDASGAPVLKIDCRHRENEMAMARAMVSSGLELLEAAGAKIQEVQRVPWEPGLAIHEAGTCRMGNDPRTSVLNRFNQCHEINNLFVTDASCFPSIGTQNPALTIVALTIRACDHAIAQLKQGCI